MSRAFVKEDDADQGDDGLPERPVSPHPNLVTPEGLAAIEAELASLAAALAAARIADDRMTAATLARDLRYWQKRRASAELISAPTDGATVQFGSTVTILREDGRRQTYRIVGEDEADPNAGTVSHVSPLAQAVIGRSVGDEIAIAGRDAEIVGID
ncbi:MAG: transcription elongation factor GreA [Rhizobiales bacterium]|nr:transcription elongation factor GreA [Hyphomicrobiales bacterium]